MDTAFLSLTLDVEPEHNDGDGSKGWSRTGIDTNRLARLKRSPRPGQQSGAYDTGMTQQRSLRGIAPLVAKEHSESRTNPSVVRRAVAFEFQTGNPLFRADGTLGGTKNVPFAKGKGWKAVPDEGTVEFVTDPTDETDRGLNDMQTTLFDLVQFALHMEAALNKVAMDEAAGAALATAKPQWAQGNHHLHAR